MPRIVTMIASATEIVCALGFEDHLVARSHECDYPPTVKHLPVCTAPKFDINASSEQIDQSVKSLLQEAASIYRVDAEMLRTLQPDVIVTQAHCEVCAVSEKDVEQAICGWLEKRPKIVCLSPNNLAEVWQSMQQVADALQIPARGTNLVRQLQTRVDQIAVRTASSTYRPTVACLEWLDPLMTVGNWVPEMVEFAGGRNLFGWAGHHSPSMSWEELCQRDPDMIIAMPCGFDLVKTRQEMRKLPSRAEWQKLKAVRAGRIYLTDGNQFFNRPGPRLVESVEILAEILHPAVCSFGHEGKGWEKLGDCG